MIARPLVALALLMGTVPLAGSAQSAPDATGQGTADAAGAVPDLERLRSWTESELATVVERYTLDREALGRRWDVPLSSGRRARFQEFYRQWAQRLEAVDMDALSLEGRIDYTLLYTEIRYEQETLEREARLADEMLSLVPFAEDVVPLLEARRRLEIPDPSATAARLAQIPGRVTESRRRIETLLDQGTPPGQVVAFRAVGALGELREAVHDWYEYYAGYDPLFTWWNREPYARLDEAIGEYTDFLRERVAGIGPGDGEPIIGDPIGADGLRSDLAHEMIAYTPAELIAIADGEFEWLEGEMLRASRDLGYGDDWKAALEHVKNLAVEPGRQTDVVRRLAVEAIEYVKRNDLVTVPPLAEEVWRMEMLSPERQRVSPFFLGGEVIRVSYPTDEMSHEDKLMSMRGNNPHFSRATVHHELIPGHHLQGFMTRRYNAHRNVFSTPFWGEGWALYWEMLLWDMGFAETPEDRIGMLFWRMHRAARIIFSLSFHLERMTPQEAIDFLVDRVGHERANAEAEVRRSFNGTYPPLYQAGYMLGGMQIRALHREFVESGAMTNRAFHDAILRGGRMPIAMVRARLSGDAPPPAFQPTWRFADIP